MFLTGLAAGLMSSMLGIGGGVVIVPLLSAVLGYSQQEAVATSLLAIALISSANALRFQMQNLIQWKLVFLIALFSATASFLAGIAGGLLSQNILILMFILFLGFMLWYTLGLKEVGFTANKNCSKSRLAMKIGLTTGVVSGLTGVGGGLITTPLLLGRPGIRNEQAVPNSNAVMLFTTSSAALAFMLTPVVQQTAYQAGYVHLDNAVFLFMGALPSVWFGAKMQRLLSLHTKKLLLSMFLLIAALKMILKLLDF